MTVLDADGHVRDTRRLSTERQVLLDYFGKVEKPARVAVEATFNWYYFLELIEPLGLEWHLVHPYKTRLDLMEAQIERLDREIRQRVKKHPVAQALEAIPGIGPFIALLLAAEIGEIERFASPKRLASYTGLAPSLHASGEQRWGGPITKRGSSLLRWALVQAAHTACRSPRFGGFYERQRERHGTAKAMVALARKLVTVVYFRWRAATRGAAPPGLSSGAHLRWRRVETPTL